MTAAQLPAGVIWLDSRPHQILVGIAVVILGAIWLSRWWLIDNGPQVLWSSTKWLAIHAVKAARATFKAAITAVKALKAHYLSPTHPELSEFESPDPGNTRDPNGDPQFTTEPAPYAPPIPPRRGRPPTEARPPVDVRCATCGHVWQSQARSGQYLSCPAKCGGRQTRVPLRPEREEVEL